MKIFAIAIAIMSISLGAEAKEVRIGSKAFTEGYLLGELAAQTAESVAETKVSRKFGLGSTGIVVQALLTNEIDVYPEYTGTIAESVFHDLSVRSTAQMQQLLKTRGLVMSRELGFENTYALAVTRQFAEANKLVSISDLKGLEGRVRPAFNAEFISRDDCLKSLVQVYGLNFGDHIQSLDHMLSYQAMADNKADLIAVYSTDDKIESLDLVLLRDDKAIFPPYRAVFLARENFVRDQPEVWNALNALGGSIREKQMRLLNGEVESRHLSPSTVIQKYLGQNKMAPSDSSNVWQEIKRRTLEHLTLVGIALLASVLIGIPLGILSFQHRRIGHAVLLASSLIQTVPSLALLCLLIPAFGIGLTPALVALFLYSLLPVIQNTILGLQSVSPQLIETARALGLTRIRVLTAIELPMASRSVLAGIRTAAIIGIGTATLAALIGAGGYGAPIISGLATNNTGLILIGAIPCAVLALLTFAVFEVANRVLVPKGLRS